MNPKWDKKGPSDGNRGKGPERGYGKQFENRDRKEGYQGKRTSDDSRGQNQNRGYGSQFDNKTPSGGYPGKRSFDDNRGQYQSKGYGNRFESRDSNEGFKDKRFVDNRVQYERKSYGNRFENKDRSDGFKDRRFGDNRGQNEKKSYGNRSESRDSNEGFKNSHFGDNRSQFEKKSYGDRFENKDRGDSFKDRRFDDNRSQFEKKSYGNRFEGKDRSDSFKDRRFGDNRNEYPRKEYGSRFEEKDRKNYAPVKRTEQGRSFEQNGKRFSDKKPYDKERDNVKQNVEQAPLEQNPDEREEAYFLMGRNPVREAVKAGRSIDKIFVAQGELEGSIREILKMAHDQHLVVKEVSRQKLDEICMPYGHGGMPGNHQGIIAYVPAKEYCTIQEIVAYAQEKGEKPFIVALDNLEDPHNLGAILRTAECAGVHGVVICKHRSVGVNAAVARASAGAVEHMRVAKAVNMTAAIKEMKELGLWIVGMSTDGEPLFKSNLKDAVALVIGSEGSGISRLVKEQCDYLLSIPIKGHVESLNASVAASVAMYEKVRQDS